MRVCQACAAHNHSSVRGRRSSRSSPAIRRPSDAGPRTADGPGGRILDLTDALAQAEEVGYPVLLKPSAGGGGRGMRLVRSPREMETSLPLSRSEAQAAFGDDAVYFEKWIEESRHVEVQVLLDRFGSGIHLGERTAASSARRSSRRRVAMTPAAARTSATWPFGR
jgi:acetyl/propionyl-CoA carboxylase alpha subunit